MYVIKNAVTERYLRHSDKGAYEWLDSPIYATSFPNCSSAVRLRNEHANAEIVDRAVEIEKYAKFLAGYNPFAATRVELPDQPSVLDQFAMAAIQGMLAAGDQSSYHQMTRDAYHLADIAMDERQRRRDEGAK